MLGRVLLLLIALSGFATATFGMICNFLLAAELRKRGIRRSFWQHTMYAGYYRQHRSKIGSPYLDFLAVSSVAGIIWAVVSIFVTQILDANLPPLD